MTAWRSGRFLGVTMLDGNARAVRQEAGPVRGSLTYELPCGDSRLTVAVTLDRGSDRLDFDVSCDWVEIGRPGKGVPRLDFILPCAFPCSFYRYDVPFGTTTRRPMAMDVPANSWAAAKRADGGERALMIVAEGKHGFRGDGDSIALALLRASYDPDPTPEVGSHTMRFAVCLAGDRDDDRSLIECGERHAHPFAILPGTAHNGKNPTVSSLFVLEHGSAVLSTVKPPEEAGGGKDIIIRVYETDGRETMVGLKFARPIERAWMVDLNEKGLSGSLEAQGDRVRFVLGAHRVAAIRVMFA